MSNKFLSICIPSYNRPDTISRLLNSIDTRYKDQIEVVICEDKSPKRDDIRTAVEIYSRKSPYEIHYFENKTNLGFDLNWIELSKKASGEFLLYMGDDDGFIPGALDQYIDWLHAHEKYCYILRSYVRVYNNDRSNIQYFRYYSGDRFFEPGVDGYKEFFLKSVSMSGYTIKRSCALEFSNHKILEGNTLLFQLYLVAEVCLKYPSAYCNTPCAELISDQPQLFGNSKEEKGVYTPGEGVSGNLNFINSFFRISEYIDNKNSLKLTPYFKEQLSKYSFYILHGQRKKGKKELRMMKEQLVIIGLGDTLPFKIYYWALMILGPSICVKAVRRLKKIIGHRPSL